METTNERLKKYLDYKGISVNAAEKAAGLNASTLQKAMKRGSSLGSDKIEKIVRVFADLDIHWLTTGEGQMIKADEQNSPATEHAAYVAEEEQQQTTTYAAASYNSIIKAQEETIRYMREELAMQQRVIDHLMAESAARTEQIAQLMTLVSKSATK